MEEPEESRSDFMQRLKNASSNNNSSSASIPKPSRLDLQNFNSPQVRGQFRHFPPSPDASKRVGIPPAHPHFPPNPYSQIPTAAATGGGGGAPRNLIPVPSHSRSLSQPAFFNLDSLPPFTSQSPPFADQEPADVAMEVGPTPPRAPPLARSSSGRVTGDGLPPRKAHRRSQSDIPFGFLQSSSAALPPLPHHLVSPRDGFKAAAAGNPFVKQESDWDREGESSVERKSDGDAGADLFSAYMNLESLDTLNSSGTEEKREESRASGTKTNGADSSENEAESSVNESGSSLKKEGNKRSANGDPVTVNLGGSRHNRSISVDSFMGKLNFGEESPKLPPSPGTQAGQHSRSGSMDGVTNTFSLEFGNGEFSGAELKKIMANEKLAEIAMTDPKRAKR